MIQRPMILAPAGDATAFLAAIAAGADAIYCGLKLFSARMEAQNFGIEELARLSRLARAHHVQLYIAFNTILKQNELEKASRILSKLVTYVDFQALIIQDIGLVPIARNAGFEGELHLSTLGNCTHPEGIAAAGEMGFSRVVLPREFNLDEVRAAAQAVPDGVDLEMFIHGALCYSVSGRCYWSSWFGGKSALRGRCVQPCRRIYDQKGQARRHFSCMDFSADVLAKVLKEIPEVTTWKIEGRKKSPHYVYYTVKAYQMLRDEPEKKKEALYFLDYAMGREFSHYNLLSQRIQNPLEHQSETGSGLFLGRVKNPDQPYFNTREELIPGDLLRIGYEEDTFHFVQRVTRAIPKKGNFFLTGKSKGQIKKGTPVFIIDRRGSELASQIQVLEQELSRIEVPNVRPVKQHNPVEPPAPSRSTRGGKKPVLRMNVVRGRTQKTREPGDTGMWISAGGYGIRPVGRTWLWLAPLLFPEEELLCRQYIHQALKKGARQFVLNSPWQIRLFPSPGKLKLWAGPYCNLANTQALYQLRQMGFSGAIVSPELDRETFLSLPASSPLPLGVVTRANWPLAVSRIISPDLSTGKVFFSPKGEAAWTTKSNQTYYTFPTWALDLTSKEEELQAAGYSLFVSLEERVPKGVRMTKRPGTWNWNLKLL